jgi:hypothetical protein
MERELWVILYHWLLEHATRHHRPKGAWYSDRIIVAVWLWAVLHERAGSWAVQRRNWPAELLCFQLPSQSTLSRRLRSDRLQHLLAHLHEALNRRFDAQQTLVKMIDAKPLPVGAYSHAKDARWGHGGRTLLRGYKLHAIYGAGPLPIAWAVVPMNASEQRVAKRLLKRLCGGGYVLADGVYEINALYRIAAAQNHQLLAPRKSPDKGIATDARDPSRLRSIDLLEGPFRTFGQTLYAMRTGIERRFSRLCSGPGLLPLPPFVRWLDKVHRWVSAKLLIEAARWYRKYRRYESTA